MMQLSAQPGVMNAGALILRPPALISMISELRTPKLEAVVSLKDATLSQVRRLMGFGNSCSHELFAQRPSNTVGSGRKTMSIPFPEGFGSPAGLTVLAATATSEALESAITPLRTASFQNMSKSEAACCFCQYVRTMS